MTKRLVLPQGILDASRQRHNALFRSKSENNLKSSAVAGSHHQATSGSSATRFIHVPRGMQVMPIPDFKPRSNSSSVVGLNSSCHHGNDENREEEQSTRGFHELDRLHVPSPLLGRRPRSWSPDEETTKMLNLRPYDGRFTWTECNGFCF